MLVFTSRSYLCKKDFISACGSSGRVRNGVGMGHSVRQPEHRAEGSHLQTPSWSKDSDLEVGRGYKPTKPKPVMAFPQQDSSLCSFMTSWNSANSGTQLIKCQSLWGWGGSLLQTTTVLWQGCAHLCMISYAHWVAQIHPCGLEKSLESLLVRITSLFKRNSHYGRYKP